MDAFGHETPTSPVADIDGDHPASVHCAVLADLCEESKQCRSLSITERPQDRLLNLGEGSVEPLKHLDAMPRDRDHVAASVTAIGIAGGEALPDEASRPRAVRSSTAHRPESRR